MEGENVSTQAHKRLELKIRELESKLELEKTTKQRMETQLQRQKEVSKSCRESGCMKASSGYREDD